MGVVRENSVPPPTEGKSFGCECITPQFRTPPPLINLPDGDMEVSSRHTAAPLTETFGCLASKVHGIQTHGALGGSHVQAHIKPVRNVVVHALFKTPAEF